MKNNNPGNIKKIRIVKSASKQQPRKGAVSPPAGGYQGSSGTFQGDVNKQVAMGQGRTSAAELVGPADFTGTTHQVGMQNPPQISQMSTHETMPSEIIGEAERRGGSRNHIGGALQKNGSQHHVSMGLPGQHAAQASLH